MGHLEEGGHTSTLGKASGERGMSPKVDPLAQSAEHLTFNQGVRRSNRRWITIMERYRSGHNEAVLKTVWAKAHVGSNPTLSVNRKGDTPLP